MRFPAAVRPDYIGHTLLTNQSHELFDKIFYAAFPDQQWTIHDLVAEGDRVAARFTMRATHTGEFQGIPATGRSISVWAFTIYRIADGKIAEEWAEFDAMGMMQQLGVIPAPDQA